MIKNFVNHKAFRKAITYLPEYQKGERAEFIFAHADGLFHFEPAKTGISGCPAIKLKLEKAIKFENERIDNDKGVFENSFTMYRFYEMEHIHPDFVVEHEDDGGLLITTEIFANPLSRIEEEKAVAFLFDKGESIEELYQYARNNPNTPDYVIKECIDPRMVGDYYSEVAETVIMVAPEFLCMESYEHFRRGRGGKIYYTYPFENKEGLKVGDKKVIHEARKRPETSEEKISDAIEFYFENDNSFELETEDFYDH